MSGRLCCFRPLTQQKGKCMQQIFEVIRKYGMIGPNMRVIVGVSGGADSVCLLYVLNEYRKQVPFELMAVHVEHGIRGAESLADAAYTEELCQRFGVPCRVCHVPVPQIAKENGQSLEEAGRAQRYRIFEELCREWQADRIAVAHNQNDQAETVLWNLVRGSGLKGLGGIRPVRGRLIRPLLFTTREKIEQVLKQAGIVWRTDRTNLEAEYTRNRIRLLVMPLLEQELNGRASEHIAQAAHRLQEIQEFLECMTEHAAKRCIREEGADVLLLLEPYKMEESLVQQELLRRVLSMCGALKDVGAVHIAMLEELTGMHCGKACHLPGRLRAVREDGVLRFTNSNIRKQSGQRIEAEYSVPVPGILRVGEWNIETELLENDPSLQKQISEEKKYTKWLSCDTIKCNVCLRKRRSGDYLTVNGQGGRKKLKDYFIDLKIPKEKRDQIWLLADGSHILWVIGYRISEAAKVSEQTKQIMKIQMKEDSE